MEHLEHALLEFNRSRVQLCEELLAIGGESHQPCPTVDLAHAPLEQALRLEAADEQTGAVSVHAQPRRKRALVEVGLAIDAVDISQYGKLQRREAGAGHRLCACARADLEEAPSERERNPPYRRTVTQLQVRDARG